MPRLIAFSCTASSPEYDHPKPERLVAGNPLRTTWEHYSNASGDISSGVWACEVGAWRIAFDAYSDEFFHVLEGRLHISDAQGLANEFGPGDACVIPAGFTGTFEVLEPVKKHYVKINRKS